MDARDEFEAKARAVYGADAMRRVGDGYDMSAVDDAWWGWRSALAHRATLLGTVRFSPSDGALTVDWEGEPPKIGTKLYGATQIDELLAQHGLTEHEIELIEELARHVPDTDALIIRKLVAAAMSSASKKSPAVEQLRSELASMTRMFHAACADLGLVNEALGLDPNDGGAEPILDAIEELKTAAGQAQGAEAWSAPCTSCATPRACQYDGCRSDEAPAVEAGARDERVSMIQTLMLDWINSKPGEEAKAAWNRIEEKLAALARASEHHNRNVLELVSGLDHIVKVAKKSRSLTRRIRWIIARAEGALNGNDQWRTIELPRDDQTRRDRLQARVKELEEMLARASEAAAGEPVAWMRTYRQFRDTQSEAPDPGYLVTSFHQNAKFATKFPGENTPLYATTQPATVPAGWKLLPPKMTDEMKDAWIMAPSHDEGYRAMFSAAPQPASEPVGKIVAFGSPDLKEVAWTNGKMPDAGTNLYAAPQPASEPVEAAAGETVAWQYRALGSRQWIVTTKDVHDDYKARNVAECRELYAAPQPASEPQGFSIQTPAISYAKYSKDGDLIEARIHNAERTKSCEVSPKGEQQAGSALSDDELALFRDTVDQFEDCGETTTDYRTLLKWANEGLLECEHFTVTKNGYAILASKGDGHAD
jgi:hypothetical protein